ncbi:MAG: immunoglobulin domain-containing protein [Verrucomicrobiota bacterium]
MKRFLFLAMSACFICGGNAQSFGWTQMSNSPTPTLRMDDIHFIDETNGWAAGGGAGTIYRTTNGGTTWNLKLNKGTGTHFRSIGFASATRGFAGNLGAGSYDGSTTDTNVLYQTFDGGDNWAVVPGLGEQGMKGFCAFHVLDSQHIYGAGRVRGPAIFVKSENAGTNWTVVDLTAAGVMNGLMDVYFKDATNGFVVGMDTNSYASGLYHGSIARTTNGGLTWAVVASTTQPTCYFWKMSWPTPEVGYVSLQQNGPMTNHIFYKTTDGGNSWVSNGIPFTQIQGTTTFYSQGIGFVNANDGWVGGSSSTSPYAINFLQTTNGGLTWATNGYNNSRSINRIRFLSPVFGYASGSRLHVFRAPLGIARQPQNQWVTKSANATLSIDAVGNNPITYQWRKSGVAIFNATNATLILTNVARTNSGSYSVLISNSFTNLVSSNAVLRVLFPQKLQTPVNLTDKVKLLFGDSDGALLTTNELGNFEVQASTNLNDWSPLTNVLSLTNGFMLLEDTKDADYKFYRVLER